MIQRLVSAKRLLTGIEREGKFHILVKPDKSRSNAVVMKDMSNTTGPGVGGNLAKYVTHSTTGNNEQLTTTLPDTE